MSVFRASLSKFKSLKGPTFPEKLKGGRIERWKNYWCGVGIDYREAFREVGGMSKRNPVKTSIYATAAVFWGYCVKTNPTELDYRINFLHNGLDLIQVSDTVRNRGSDNLQNYVSKAFNANLIRRTNFGVCSIMWVDDYAPELGLFAARCEYLKPGWGDLRYRLLDVGFLGRWWISERKMAEFDVNGDEWNTSGTANNPDGQLKQMW